MARAGRQKSASGVYHVLLRGVDKLFLDSSDYIEFRSKMAEYFGTEVRLLAYLLLPNRVHLLVDEGNAELSLALKPLCTSYARYFNRIYSVDGKLFYDRYKSVPAETSDEIADTVAFMNAIGSEFAPAENYSLTEYERRAALCDTSRLRALVGAAVTSKKPKALHLDDYSQLTREEMERYLKVVANSSLDALAAADRQSEDFKRLFSGSVSARAVLPLFGIHSAPAAKKNPPVDDAPAAAPESKPEKPNTPEKKNLSVWLL